MKRILATLGVICALAPAASATAAVSAPAAGAGAIHISAPGPVTHGAVYDLTVSGFARRRATAYVFVDYARCAPTLSEELQRAPHGYDSYAVTGSFAQVSGWKSSTAGIDHACAYLVSRGGLPLARARLAFAVR